MHDRLRRARALKYESPKEAAEAFGWNYNTYASNENGNAPFSYRAALKYAAAFKVNPEWLYRGEGPMTVTGKPRNPPIRIPLISWVAAGQLRDPSSAGEADEWIEAAGLEPGEYFATKVVGNSMDRISPEGSIVIADTRQIKPVDGKAYIFEVEGETTYKIYYGEPVVRLEPFSTDPSYRPIFINGQTWRVVGRVVRSIFDL